MNGTVKLAWEHSNCKFILTHLFLTMLIQNLLLLLIRFCSVRIQYFTHVIIFEQS